MKTNNPHDILFLPFFLLMKSKILSNNPVAEYLGEMSVLVCRITEYIGQQNIILLCMLSLFHSLSFHAIKRLSKQFKISSLGENVFFAENEIFFLSRQLIRFLPCRQRNNTDKTDQRKSFNHLYHGWLTKVSERISHSISISVEMMRWE